MLLIQPFYQVRSSIITSNCIQKQNNDRKPLTRLLSGISTNCDLNVQNVQKEFDFSKLKHAVSSDLTAVNFTLYQTTVL